eukprot:1767724-Pleurochrysis_carterae.AAC.8
MPTERDTNRGPTASMVRCDAADAACDRHLSGFAPSARRGGAMCSGCMRRLPSGPPSLTPFVTRCSCRPVPPYTWRPVPIVCT